MKEIVKAFKHIARDILIYIIPGLTLVGSICYLFYPDYKVADWDSFLTFKIFLVLTFMSYIFGHIILGFMEIIFIMFPIEKHIKRVLFAKEVNELEESSKSHKDGELEILAFSHKKAYEFFVERHTQLSLFRWNMSGTFLLVAIMFLLTSIWHYHPSFIWIALISMLSFIILLLLSIRTEFDGNQRRAMLAHRK